MYTLLLVDDEPEIREGLQEVIDLPALGFSVVGEAGNGVEGLRLAEALRPDLIITDIRMPLLSGLSMAAQVKKVSPTTQFIILSGYDEFEYARQAIEITALRYLLKPISSVELVAVLEDVKRRLDEDFARRRDLTRLRAHFTSSLPLLRELLLSSLLAGKMDAERALPMAARYGMDLKSPAYAVAMVRMPLPDTASPAEIDDPELLFFAVSNILSEVLASCPSHHLFHMDDMLAALLLLPAGDHPALSGAAEALDAARQNVERCLGQPLQIGLSAPCEALSALPACTRQALSAVHHLGAQREGQVLCITDIAPSRGQAFIPDEYMLRVLNNNLKLGDAQQAASAVSSLLDAGSRATLSDWRAYLLEILMVFIRAARDLDLSAQEDALVAAQEQLMRCPPPAQAETVFTALCGRFAASVTESRASSSHLLAAEAAAYMQRHYMDEDLTMDKLCGHLHISSSYFGSLFKKETRKTFTQYLTEVRMDKAMTLLASTDLRTAEIAVRVGISDPSYFSYAFRRHFGVSPSAARGRRETSP